MDKPTKQGCLWLLIGRAKRVGERIAPSVMERVYAWAEREMDEEKREQEAKR